ncbi:uncharacterized protein N7482_007339 [Penicillium canariense]|uniref:Uncharacterized protein n=1 Tax=Penicillium canariense TaxID=189055 RepID=A0A9W9HZD3_9EURO|nr:uncharacterized protein N7482_007339 [Penicillium canariense]KAJ5160335.1 hypothetical protein N7482_007339 [Penicillium canariense]
MTSPSSAVRSDLQESVSAIFDDSWGSERTADEGEVMFVVSVMLEQLGRRERAIEAQGINRLPLLQGTQH